MKDSSTVLSIEGLSVSYDKKRVLRNIYAQFHAGKVYGVVGPNGAGKSSLFKAILGLIEYNSGEIRVFGQALDEVRTRVAYIPQKEDVDWDFPATVRDIVLMGRYPHKRLFGRINKKDHQLTTEALEYLGILALQDRQIGGLSGGQQQRVFLARALCQKADLFLLDEPFVGVDSTTEQSIVRILHELRNQGKTLLVIHHDLSKVSEYFDEVVLLNRRIVDMGPVEQVFVEETIRETYKSPSDILLRT